MFAVLAVILFAIALILHLVGGGNAGLVLDFVIAGAICVAAHLAFGWPAPWHRQP